MSRWLQLALVITGDTRANTAPPSIISPPAIMPPMAWLSAGEKPRFLETGLEVVVAGCGLAHFLTPMLRR